METLFISHNGLTVFLNKAREGYSVKTTEHLENGSWKTSGFMRVGSEDFKRFAELIGELAQ